MKVDLNVSATSDVRKMSGCSKAWEHECGIMYRGGAEQKIRKYLIDNNYIYKKCNCGLLYFDMLASQFI